MMKKSEVNAYQLQLAVLSQKKELIGTIFMGHGDPKGNLGNNYDVPMASETTELSYKLKFAKIRACHSNNNKLRNYARDYTGYDGILIPMPFCNGGGLDLF